MTGKKRERRLGLVGYADVVKMIQRVPATSVSISAHLGWEERRMNMNLRLWQKFGVVHCVRWESPGAGRARAEVWKFGAGENAPRPPEMTRQLIKPHALRSRAHSFAVIVNELLEGATVDDVAETSGITRRIVAELLVEMHAIRLLYVSEWNRRSCGGEPIPVYKVGRNADTPRPAPLGNVAAVRKYRKTARLRKIGAVLNRIAVAQ